MIAVALIAAATVFVLQTFVKKKPSLESIVNDYNVVLQQALTMTLLTKKTHQVRFFFDDDGLCHTIGINPMEKNKNLHNNTMEKKIIMKTPIKMTSLFIDGKNELANGKTRETWIKIYPEGYAQECSISFIMPDGVQGTYRLNPFICALRDEDYDAKKT